MRNFKCIFIVLPAFLLSITARSQTAVQIKFENVVGDIPLVLDSGIYRNQNGDSFSVSMYKYYISNVSFYQDNGSRFDEQESYHLVNEAKAASGNFTIKNITPGRYTKMRFMVGVDSLHNVDGAQSGALDPINAMFWDWNTGYIMAKMEGTLKNKEQQEIAFHIGGFSGSTSTLRWVDINFPQALVVNDAKNRIITLTSDVAEWFKTPNIIDFSKTPVVTAEGKDAAAIADNYADMFHLQGIE